MQMLAEDAVLGSLTENNKILNSLVLQAFMKSSN
jgi:hypothetical protein